MLRPQLERNGFIQPLQATCLGGYFIILKVTMVYSYFLCFLKLLGVFENERAVFDGIESEKVNYNN